MIAQDDPYTGHQEVVPRNFAVAKHPGERGHGVGSQTGALKPGPANRLGNEDGGETKGEPGALNGGHAVKGMFPANSLVNGIDKSADKGDRFCEDHGLSKPSMLPK